MPKLVASTIMTNLWRRSPLLLALCFAAPISVVATVRAAPTTTTATADEDRSSHMMRSTVPLHLQLSPDHQTVGPAALLQEDVVFSRQTPARNADGALPTGSLRTVSFQNRRSKVQEYHPRPSDRMLSSPHEDTRFPVASAKSNAGSAKKQNAKLSILSTVCRAVLPPMNEREVRSVWDPVQRRGDIMKRFHVVGISRILEPFGDCRPCDSRTWFGNSLHTTARPTARP